MPDDDRYKQFADTRRAVIVAPAGCGKTELIARAVGYCPPHSRQLVLTHTHAGVDAIRGRLRRIKVPASRYHVETIHSFALRYAAAYPKSSAIKNIMPRTNEDYTDIVESAQRLVKTRLVREVLRLSYGGVFVDEYQDCSLDQHDLILGLAEVLPCRIVGDPLQGIFDFGGHQIVHWDRHVYANFVRLPDLSEPWRWKNANPHLGRWLTEVVRPAFERHEPLVLPCESQPSICMWTQDISGQYSAAKRILVLKEALGHNETTFAICNPTQTPLPHSLARSLKNCYHSLEPTWSDELHNVAKDIQERTGEERLQVVHDFAGMCLTAQDDLGAVMNAIRNGSSLKSDTRRALHKLAMQIVSEASLGPVASLFEFVMENGTPTIWRHQLWHEMRRALAEVISGSVHSLVEATHLVRNRGAIMGRRIPKRCISRTLLLKGLECEHAIVVDADSMDTKNLYVALTRGSRNLHILSKERLLWASDARRMCPICGSQLAWRSGPDKPFLICSTYPACRHGEPLRA